MLLYLYFISLLLCMDCTISYNYIEDSLRSNAYNSARHVKKSRKASRGKNRHASLRKEFEYDRSPVEFDVASFIQPEYDSIEDDEAYKSRNKNRRQSISKSLDFGSIVGLNTDASLNMKDTDLGIHSSPELSDNSMPLKDSINHKHVNAIDKTNAKCIHDKHNIQNAKISLNQYFSHSPEKKCIFRHMRLPFFSHNKTDSAVKKNKKRKLMCFNCPKKNSEPSTTPQIQYKIKRSYIERLCPSCKKKYTADLPSANRKKKTPSNFKSSHKRNKKQKDKFKKQTEIKYFLNDTIRNKRQENAREQYLKELEEVQRKIDSVPVTIPKFEKSTRGLR